MHEEDISHPSPLGGGEPLTAPLRPPSEQSSSLRWKPRTAASELSVSTLVEQYQREIQAYRRGEATDETYGVELLRRAIEHGDQDAWAGLQHSLSELVRGWLYSDPRRELALRWQSEQTYVVLAFERFWQRTVGQHIAFKTLAGALTYLRASLNGAILDTLRTYARPAVVPLTEPGTAGEPSSQDGPASLELWEILQRMLPSERERRMAYLLYHCNLKPREIVRFCQQEWPDVREIYRLRRAIVERLLRNADQLRWRRNH